MNNSKMLHDVMSNPPVPPHHAHGHLLPHHHPPHPFGHAHMPPHMRSSKIKLEYDENAIARINQLYGGNIGYVIGQIETCPPEIKLTLAILLGIKTDLSEYPLDVHSKHRFDLPFMTEKNAEIIAQALHSEDVTAVMTIYNTCPPEQAILALAAANLTNSGEKT